MIRIMTVKNDQKRITWSLPLLEPEGAVSVVGDFNDWTPGVTTLRTRSNGTRSVSIVVPVGTTVRFRYLGPNGQWFDDHAADRDDENCLVSV